MLLTDKQIAEICVDISLDTSCDIAYVRAIESAVLKKLNEQEPVAWQIRNGLCHAGIRGNQLDAELTAANMQKCHDLGGSLAAFNVRPLYAHPLQPGDVVRDPRAAELEAALRECREVLMHYQYGKSRYKEPADKAIAKIDAVLK